MLITITAPGEYLEGSPDAPQIGRTYQLEPADTATNRQNRAFHALLQEYWRSGMHSYHARSFKEFRDMIKRDLGAGFESYVYATPDGVRKAKTRVEIPAAYNNAKYTLGKLKSWGDYTKKERTETIDRIIAEMVQAGVNTPKFAEIIAGMENHETDQHTA